MAAAVAVRYRDDYPSVPFYGPARPAIVDALRAWFAGSPVGSHSTYKQLRCLLYGAGPAITDALRARFAGSPVGSHSTYKQLRCLLYGAVLTRGAEMQSRIADSGQ